METGTDRVTRRAGSVIVVCAVVLAAMLVIGRAQVASAAPGCPPGVTNSFYCAPPQITATMEWTFFYSPRYGRVMSLGVSSAARTTVLVTCRGRGCPYKRHSVFVGATKPCGKNGKSICPTHGTLNLTRPFKKRHLAIGTKLSIAITRSGWIGKYYLFKIRSAQPPRISIDCLAPGSSVPTGAC